MAKIFSVYFLLIIILCDEIAAYATNTPPTFWTAEKKKAINNLSQEENLDFKRLVDIISNYLFTQKEPLRDEVIAVMNERPSLKNRAYSSERIITKIKDFINTFIEGMG